VTSRADDHEKNRRVESPATLTRTFIAFRGPQAHIDTDNRQAARTDKHQKHRTDNRRKDCTDNLQENRTDNRQKPRTDNRQAARTDKHQKHGTDQHQEAVHSDDGSDAVAGRHPPVSRSR
jgi:hypothetical protein